MVPSVMRTLAEPLTCRAAPWKSFPAPRTCIVRSKAPVAAPALPNNSTSLPTLVPLTVASCASAMRLVARSSSSVDS